MLKTEECRSVHSCRCTLCDRVLLTETAPASSPVPDGELQSFAWLLEQLGASKSVGFAIPETLVYKDGVCQFMLASTGAKTRFITNADSLKPNQIVTYFNELARKRRRDLTELPTRIYQYTSAEAAAEPYNNEVAIVKLNSGAIRVTTEAEFAKLLYERGGSSVWKQIEFIQSILKVRAGIGPCKLVEFCPGVTNEFTSIAAALRRVHWEVLSGTAEFQVDDDGQEWLFSVTHLRVRSLAVQTLPQLRLPVPAKQALHSALSEHENLGRPRVHKLLGLMSEYYAKIKADSGAQNLTEMEFHTVLPKRELPSIGLKRQPASQATSLDTASTKTQHRRRRFPLRLL